MGFVLFFNFLETSFWLLEWKTVNEISAGKF